MAGLRMKPSVQESVPEPDAALDSGHRGATLVETVDLGAPTTTGDQPQPARVGRYTVLRRLGAGGMGTVWSAFDETLDRRVAIKVLVSDDRSDRSRERTLREAKALARLNHPNVVQVFEVGELGDDVYLAMEFVRGESLADWLEQPRSFAEILDAFVQAGRGLLAVHGARLVHRDFKPHNVVVGDDGRVRLIDFGIARLADDGGTDAAPLDLEDVDASLDRLTRTGQFVGTPAFMSPEQLRGNPVDARSDQFSFCVALYRAVYRCPPFAGEKVGALVLNVLQGNFAEPPRTSGVPPRLLPVLRKGLAVDPDERHPEMGALLAALDQLRPRRAARARWAVASAALGGAGLAVVLARSDSDACSGGGDAFATVWNDDRSAVIARGFVDAGAAATWTRAAGAIDGLGDDWTAQHRDACEAHRRGEQSAVLLDRRMACLDAGKRQLDALLGEFEQFDAALVSAVGEAIAELPLPSRCGEAARLESGEHAEVPPELADEVAELTAILDRAEAQERSGRSPRARETLLPIIPLVDRLQWPGPAIRLHAMLAGIDRSEGRFAEAQRELETSFRLAVIHGYDDAARDASMSLASVIGVLQGRFADAEAWLAVADAWIERTGASTLERAEWQQTAAGIREREGRYDDAQALLEQLLANLATVEDGSALTVLASANNAIGFVYRAQRRYADAEAAFLRAREHWIALLGPEHPLTTEPLNNLGTLYMDELRFDDAERVFTEAMVLREQVFGHRHPKVAHILLNLGIVENKRGRFDEALRRQNEALSILEDALGANDPSVAVAVVAVGETHVARQEPAAALPFIRRALAIDEAAVGPDHPDVAWDLNSLAVVLNDLEQWEEARRAAERAIVIRAAHVTPDRVGQSRLELAKALVGLGRLDEARAAARQAIVEYAAEPDTQATIQAWLDELGAPGAPGLTPRPAAG
jgi:tetratricopeptide (TPR) repeat protein/predicted Ser/Thr protein kinase